MYKFHTVFRASVLNSFCAMDPVESFESLVKPMNSFSEKKIVFKCIK